MKLCLKNFDFASTKSLPLCERFIISRIHQVTMEMTLALEQLRFGDAGAIIHNFLWNEFADWYLETSKVRMRSGDANSVQVTRETLLYVWDTSLKLLHPFMPFLTETLWQLMSHEGDSIMISSWPLLEGQEHPHVDATAIREFRQFQSLVGAVRNARTAHNLELNKKSGFILKAPEAFCVRMMEEVDVFCMLARVEKKNFSIISHNSDILESDAYVHVVADEGVEGFIPLEGLVNVEKETLRLKKQRDGLMKTVTALECRLTNKVFTERAPEPVVQEVRENVVNIREQLRLLNASLEKLNLNVSKM